MVGKMTDAYAREYDHVESYLVEQWKKRMGPGARCDKVENKTKRGYPDRTCMAAGGIFVLVECKAPKGRIADHQRREHKRLRDLGFKVYVPFTRKCVDEMIDELLFERD